MMKAPHAIFQMKPTDANGRREELLRRARSIASNLGERVHKLLGEEKIDGQPPAATEDNPRSCTD